MLDLVPPRTQPPPILPVHGPKRRRRAPLGRSGDRWPRGPFVSRPIDGHIHASRRIQRPLRRASRRSWSPSDLVAFLSPTSLYGASACRAVGLWRWHIGAEEARWRQWPGREGGGASLAAAVRAVAATARPASSAAAAAGVSVAAAILKGNDTPFGSVGWWAYAGISCFLVLFAGIMSGLTLRLMSLGLVELEILQRSGTDSEKAQAGPIRTPNFSPTILPVVQKQHQLLVTLLLCNAVAMEDFHPVVAVVLSVTFVIPQAICTRYGLAVGANFVWLVLLDCALGHNESALFKRAQLKALVSIHSKEAGKGGELTHDETTIISGALDLTEKTAQEAMTPIESTFSLDVDSKLDCRVPVYSGNPRNVIGLLLVKSLLTVRAETETPVSARPKNPPAADTSEPNMEATGATQLTAPLLSNAEERAESVVVDIEAPQSRQVNGNKHQSVHQSDKPSSGVGGSSEDIEEGEVIGIITLEDVFEELLQEEIVDETDEYVDVHKRIRVAAAAAASSVARAPSVRRLTAQKASGAQSRQGQSGQPAGILKKPATEGDSNPSKQVNLVEPLLENRRQL
ncbi:hypothetical protein ZWY2020_027811 [Hordeum vulgare]|nr:hypothetical protein ZWY2020_027811 [Hordeum vulgare]